MNSIVLIIITDMQNKNELFDITHQLFSSINVI